MRRIRSAFDGHVYVSVKQYAIDPVVNDFNRLNSL